MDSLSFDSFDKTPTFAEASEGRQGRVVSVAILW
jgi:hypothetical protein